MRANQPCAAFDERRVVEPVAAPQADPHRAAFNVRAMQTEIAERVQRIPQYCRVLSSFGPAHRARMRAGAETRRHAPALRQVAYGDAEVDRLLLVPVRQHPGAAAEEQRIRRLELRLVQAAAPEVVAAEIDQLVGQRDATGPGVPYYTGRLRRAARHPGVFRDRTQIADAAMQAVGAGPLFRQSHAGFVTASGVECNRDREVARVARPLRPQCDFDRLRGRGDRQR